MTRSSRCSYLLAGVVVPGLVLLLALGPVRPAGAADPPVVGDRSVDTVDAASGGDHGVDDAAVDDDRRVVSFSPNSAEQGIGLTVGAAIVALAGGFAVHLVVRRAAAPLHQGIPFGKGGRTAP
jgi:hypothetical protein